MFRPIESLSGVPIARTRTDGWLLQRNKQTWGLWEDSLYSYLGPPIYFLKLLLTVNMYMCICKLEINSLSLSLSLLNMKMSLKDIGNFLILRSNAKIAAWYSTKSASFSICELRKRGSV